MITISDKNVVRILMVSLVLLVREEHNNHAYWTACFNCFNHHSCRVYFDSSAFFESIKLPDNLFESFRSEMYLSKITTQEALFVVV